MTVLDYAVLGIVGLSVLISIMRGLVRELLALFSWVAAFLVAVPGSVAVVPYLPVSVPDGVRYIAAFIIVFSIVWLTFSFASIAAAELIKAFKLGWLDKALGAFFGLIKGMVIVTVLVLLAGLTVLPRETFWKEAVFSTPLEAWVKFLKPWLPVELSKRLKYD